MVQGTRGSFSTRQGQGRRRLGRVVDRVMLQLVRLVVDDGWNACDAARSLRQVTTDDAVLRSARSRVDRAALDGRSRFTERAQLTLNAAIEHPGELPSDRCPAAACGACATVHHTTAGSHR